MKKLRPEDVRLSNPDKVMYPDAHFTKRDVANYYLSVGDAILPHLKGRPITLKRYPNGVDGEFFYERRCPLHRPDWVATAKVESTTHEEGVHHCVINDPASLLWVVNLASLEMHTLLATQQHVTRPTQVMFDLDPGAPAGLLECAEVAFQLKEVFESFKLKSFIKTSGGKGLHFAIPLNTSVTYDETKRFAHSIALLMEQEMPKRVVSKMLKSLRVGKVLVDWSQNDNHKTTVAPYSLRARSRPTVSTPLNWEELERFYKKKDPQLITFEAKDLAARLRKYGDLFKPVLTLKQKLPREARLKAEVAG